jgi:hypothetical protein
MNEIPAGRIVHVTPNRVRVKVPEKRRDASYFGAALAELGERPTVERVEVNPATATILVHTSDSLALIATLKREGPFAIVEQAAAEQLDPFIHVRRTLSGWDEQVRHWTGGRYNASRASAVLAVGAVVALQFVRGRRLSAAVTLVLYGGRALQRWWLAADASDSNRLTNAGNPPQLSDQMVG